MALIYRIKNLSNQAINLNPKNPNNSPHRKVMTDGEVFLPAENVSGYTLRLADKGFISAQEIELPDEETVNEEVAQAEEDLGLEENEEVIEESDEIDMESDLSEDGELTLDDLMSKYRNELDELATELGLDPADYANKQEIATAILESQNSGL